jgi:hypothetical protein
VFWWREGSFGVTERAGWAEGAESSEVGGAEGVWPVGAWTGRA